MVSSWSNKLVIYFYSYIIYSLISVLNPHEALLNYFSFNLDKIIKDEIVDNLNPLVKGSFLNNSLPFYNNPDLNNSFNYGYNYSWNDLNPGKFLTGSAIGGITLSPTTSGDCDPACKVCFNSSNGSCLTCNSGYGLIGNSCKANGPTPFYFFKSPSGIPPATKLSLNIAPLNLAAYPGLTIFMYLKIYGFLNTAPNKKIITFGPNFDLFSDPATFGLSLNYGGILQFNYADLQQDYFGKWVTISIAMYRSINPSLTPHMNAMSILYTNLERKDVTMSSYAVTELSISSSFIGLVSDINIYKSFIINAYGFASQ